MTFFLYAVEFLLQLSPLLLKFGIYLSQIKTIWAMCENSNTLNKPAAQYQDFAPLSYVNIEICFP